MKSFDVPSFIERPTGVLALDILPLLSLLPCCFTLNVFYKTRRYGDLVVYGIGLILAFVYHFCQMHREGLQATSLLNIPGTVWRSYDILSCLVILTRTVSHVFAATTLPYSILPNIVFPSLLLTISVCAERVEMGMLVMLALGTMVATALTSILFRGPEYLPSFRKGGSITCCFYLAALFLFLPNFVGNYWLFHSLWHLLLAGGYHQLILEIEEANLRDYENGQIKRGS